MTTKEVNSVPIYSKAYNLLWIPPRFPDKSITEGISEFSGLETLSQIPEREGPPFCQPIPDKTVKNMIGIAERNESVDVRLWIDSQRMTRPQMQWLQEMTEGCPPQNLRLADLESIAEYRNDVWYHIPDNSSQWRSDKHSLIWRQVDTARILASLQGNYEQVFYSDADITNLVVDSVPVQEIIRKHGVIVAGWKNNVRAIEYENQLFGFTHARKNLFWRLYSQTIEWAKSFGENGYSSFLSFINEELVGKEKINPREIVFSPQFDFTPASHPDLDKHCPLLPTNTVSRYADFLRKKHFLTQEQPVLNAPFHEMSHLPPREISFSITIKEHLTTLLVDSFLTTNYIRGKDTI